MLDIGRRLKGFGLHPTGEAAILEEDRRNTMQLLSKAKVVAYVNDYNTLRREEDVLNLVWTHLSDGPMYKAIRALPSNRSTVSRGSNHKSLDDEALAKEVKAVANRRNDLLTALANAAKLTIRIDERYGRLSRTYYKDLKEHRKRHGQDTRPAFDAQFCTDGARAMQDMGTAERNQHRIRTRLKKERLRRLEDMDSDFEDQARDGLSWSENTGARDVRRVQAEMDRELVENYLGNLHDGDLVDPLEENASMPPSLNRWGAETIDIGDPTAGLAAGAETRMGRTIRDWRTEMERVRQQEDDRR